MIQPRMRGAITIMMLLAILIVPAAATAAQKDGQPRAVVENRDYDFGTVYAGNNIIHSFVIQNQGDAPLEIGSVRTG